MAKESARLGSARVRKLVHVDRKEVRKFKRGLPGLICASRDAPARMCILRCTCSKAPTGERASLGGSLREDFIPAVEGAVVPGHSLPYSS
ncbi:hypothetical protein B296_00040661 [Ensete ventricosum]|uniref:Uncharacterized protein n=1 Tax=Ensete ventricosum TaxID=4639 RepID=A0A426Z1A9_ENSVE|nr:hypothetical protein B296_00040661 [Ensete ventricosum]